MKIDPEIEKLIPPLKSEEYQGLEEKILNEGFTEPLVVWKEQNILLDGHHRLKICEKYGIEPKFRYISFNSRKEAINWVIDNQLSRRNLDPFEASVLRGKKYLLEKKEVGRPKGVHFEHLKTREKIAQETGVSSLTIHRDAQLAEAVEELTKEIPKEILKQNPKKDIIELYHKPKEKREKIIRMIKEKDIPIGKALKIYERQEEIEQQKEAIKKGKINLPQGEYEVVVIDPPWNYGRKYDPDGSRVASPYPEMSKEELLQLRIPFASNAVCFLWTTHAFIFDAKELLDKWGFDYKGILVWDKKKIGMGHWLSMQCEFCLIGIKGKPIWENTKWRDIIREPRREHSRKPETFYKMVEEITVGRRLDVFSREKRKGWDVFGNDTEKFKRLA